MQNKLLISTVLLLSIVAGGAHMQARQATITSLENPCTEESDAGKKKEPVDYDPLVDPAELMRLRAQKKMEEKNFKEMQDAATDLASLSMKMSKEIDAGGQYVVSLRVLDQLDQIEKLTKKVRSRAK